MNSFFIKKKIERGIWSIKVFNSQTFISKPPQHDNFKTPTIQASDVTDVPAEFIADPFITFHNSCYFMFFEILNKVSGKGLIGLATSLDGENWNYDKVILKEDFHLSYPYVFKNKEDIYMIPESSEAKKVLLYKAKNFPYDWELSDVLLEGGYVDSSIFQYNDKWWIFAAKSGKLHLFFSNKLKEDWMEHPKSPLISGNRNITRPGGRVIVDGNSIYRYTQDCDPSYGRAIRVFKITLLTEAEFKEEEVNLILRGTDCENDWRKDGMHTIDQLKIGDNKWLIAVDGHHLKYKNYFLWKLDCLFTKTLFRVRGFVKLGL